MKSACSAVLAAGLVAAVAVPAAARAPEAELVSKLDSEMNSGRVEGALALFGDDATVKDPTGLVYAGRTKIREWLSALLGQKYHADSGNRQVSAGGRVTWAASMSYDSLIRLKVAPLDAFGEAVVRDGRIRSLVMRLSAAATLRLQNATLAANREAIRVAVDEIFNSGRGEAVQKHLDAGFVDRTPFPGSAADREGFGEGVAALRQAFPDLKVIVEDLMVDQDKVIARLSAHGTQTGAFLGHPATGRSFSVTEIRIFRLKDGRIVEHWGLGSREAVLAQLGQAPAVKPAAAPVVESNIPGYQAVMAGGPSYTIRESKSASDMAKEIAEALARMKAAAPQSGQAPSQTDRKKTTPWY